MLKQRIVTGLVFASLVLAVVLFTSPLITATLFGLLVLGGAWEWSALAGFRSLAARAVCVVLVAATMGIGVRALGSVAAADGRALVAVIGPVLGFWALAALAVKAYPAGSDVWGSRWSLLLVGLVVLVPPWLALVFLRALPQGEYLLIYVIALIAFADMGAFFAGRRIGGPKLMPRVSPGKTWEGLAGATLAVDDITAAVTVQLAAFKRPKASIIVDELPRNAMGKVQKAELRDKYKDLFIRRSA